MSRLSKQYIAPILVIVVGLGWLLNVQGIIPDVDWVWTCGLAAAGVLTLAAGGVDRMTIVLGPFLVIASLCSLMRQTGHLTMEKEVPILTIILGCLLLLSRAWKAGSAGTSDDDPTKKG